MRFNVCYLSKRISVAFILLYVVTAAWNYAAVFFYGHAYQRFIFNNADSESLEDQNKESNCEVIHLGAVFVGYESSFSFYTMLKSLYFYRSNPLQLHLIVDDKSEKTLRVIFQTWAVPQVSTNFYSIKNSSLDSWIMPQWKKADVQEIFKLFFLKIVPVDTTDKLIVINNDIIFTTNIYNLWNLFNSFNYKQAIGVSKSQRSTALSGSTVNNKFDTSVIMYHTKRLTPPEWEELWFSVVSEALSNIKVDEHVTPNIINAVVQDKLDMVYLLPCQWNNSTDSDKVVGCSSVTKFGAINTEASQLYQYDGSLLRHGPRCMDTTALSVTTEQPVVGMCSDFHTSVSHRWRTLTFLRKFTYSTSANDVTFVSQLAYNRLKILEEVVKRWDGPMSITFFVTDPELHGCLDFIENSMVLQNRTDVAYHAIFKEKSYYPINVLRNVALRNIVTPYAFLLDIDFLPMPNLHSILKAEITSMPTMHKKALVIPAFETQHIIPTTKAELLTMLDNHHVLSFHYTKYRPAHKPTNYSAWRTAKVPYKIQWKPEYEPYIVVQKNVTEYDVRFFGYGWNKVSHIMELHKQKYDFIVLPYAFIVHKNHRMSKERMKFLATKKLFNCLQILKRQFAQELNKKYTRTSVT